MIDRQLDAVDRDVTVRTRDGREARTVTVGQTYPTTAEDLWDACTAPERIARWFLPVSGDLQEGGRYQLEGNAGGTIQTCDPPRMFTATWEFGGAVSWIEVRIVDEGGEHARFELSHTMHVDDHWRLYGPGATGIGWDSVLLGLAMHLQAPDGKVDPAEVQKWMASADGVRFFSTSSERWAQAGVAAGEDAEWAREAAERTTAAYTGQPSES